jgi:transposase
VPHYPSDLSDEQWTVLEPQARAVMRELVIAAGRPMVHDLRAMVDAIGYVTRNGDRVAGRARRLPALGLGLRVLPAVERPRPAAAPGRAAARKAPRAPGPAAGADRVHCRFPDREVRGYRRQGDERLSRREEDHRPRPPPRRGHRGLAAGLAVTAASVSDKAGARLVTARLIMLLATLKIMWADTGYNGSPLRDWMRETAGITLEIVSRTSPHTFQVLKRRWVVERTFGWLMRYRRLARDYERTIEHHEAMIWWATVFIMTKRLTRHETGQPPPPRWGGERPRPVQQAALSTGS